MNGIKIAWALSEIGAVLLGARSLGYTPVENVITDPTGVFVVLAAAGAISLGDKVVDY